MTGRRKIAATLAALSIAGTVAAPALAGDPGGASPDVIGLPSAQEIVVRVGNPVVRASGNGIALAARSTAMVDGRVRISGTAPPTSGSVRIEREDARNGWVAVLQAPVADDGRFRALWRPDRPGPMRLRARLSAEGRQAGETPADDASPQLELTVYRPGVATWYGPTSSEWGTACGVPLLPWTLGVAHKTLPCGTSVAFYYRGRTVVVPVIDRGPFAPGRTWDLTRAAHTALGATEGVITLGALPLPTAAPARGR